MTEEVLALGNLGPLTIRGRMAYGLCLLEQAVLKEDICVPEVDQILDDFWAFVSSENLAGWEQLLKGRKEQENVFCIFDHIEAIDSGTKPERKLPAGSPFIKLDIRVFRMAEATYWIGAHYLYGTAEPGAPVCTDHIREILRLGGDFNLRLPPAALFENCIKQSETEPSIWGDTFSSEPFRAWVRQVSG